MFLILCDAALIKTFAMCRPMPPSKMVENENEDENEEGIVKKEVKEDKVRKEVKKEQEQEQEQDLMVMDREAMAEQPQAGGELHTLLKNSLDLVRQALVAIRERLH